MRTSPQRIRRGILLAIGGALLCIPMFTGVFYIWSQLFGFVLHLFGAGV
ncbi:hypothetical protein [Hoeflea sp. TYP-13]